MELIKYSVSEYGFHVPTSMTDGVWKQAFQELGQDEPSPSSDVYQLEDKVYKEKLRMQQDNKQVYLSPSWSVEQVSELITGHNPFYIAKDFTEADLDNAGLGELSEYEVKINQIEQSLKKNGVESKDLKKWLKKGTRKFLDSILISLDATDDVIKTASLVKKRNEIAKSILKENEGDNRTIAKIKHFAQESDANKQLIKDAKDALEELQEKYVEAKEDVQDAREEYKTTIEGLEKCSTYDLDEQQLSNYEGNIKRSDKIKAKKKRERTRYQGLLSYAKGVAAATIDGIAPQYIKAAESIGNEVMKASQNIIETHPSQGVEAGSNEQTKLVIEGVEDTTKSLLNVYASEDRLRLTKAFEASTSPELDLGTQEENAPEEVNSNQ